MRLSVHRAPGSHGAFALVVVMICLVLVVITVVGFLASVQLDRQSSRGYLEQQQARNLAQASLDLVQSQIRAATSEGINAFGEATTTWASQPGMLRTFLTDGNLSRAYKLYSSEVMVVPRTGNNNSVNVSLDLPADWAGRPDEFVDLNEPVLIAPGERSYPVVNPETSPALQPAGFALDPAPGNPSNPAAMPVRWLYVMADGLIGPRSAATSTNPIAGRIAFWTDDESSKINVNTATASNQASWWDIPRSAGRPERIDFSERQPVAFEYQRYPGHPATVNLTAALGGFSGLSAMADWFEAFPRYTWGGSRNASVVTSGSSAGSIPALPLDAGGRLYATVDEFAFQDGSGAGPRTANPLVPPSRVADANFFLTAASRSPDLNPFGQPRVLLWPVDTRPTHRTLFDEYIALCGTVGNLPFYFQRQDSLSASVDAGLAGNTRLRNYLTGLFSRDLPGYPGRVADSFGSYLDQLTTSIFDFIRVVNLNETYPGAVAGNLPSFTRNQNRLETFVTEQAAFAGAGFVVPSAIGTTRGMGRMPVISEAGLWIISVQNDPADVAGENLLQAALILETFSPMQGYMPWQPNYDIVVTASTLTLQGSEDAAPQAVLTGLPRSYRSVFSPLNASYGQALGGTDGFGYLMFSNNSGTPDYGVAKIPAYQFISPSLNIEGDTITFGGTVAVELRSPGGVTSQTYEFSFPAVSLPRPGKVAPPDLTGISARPDRRHHWQTQDRRPLRTVAVGKHTAISNEVRLLNFHPQDVVRSVQLSHGDYRLLSLTQSVPASAFVPSGPGYYDSGLRQVHSMRLGWNQYLRGATMGSYVAASYFDVSDGNFGVSSQPDIHPDITSLRPLWAGDFDNGIGYSVDGPFFNKPDEGARTHQGEPYFNTLWRRSEGLFCPSRQVPSAGMFGSIPRSGQPWETLLFCPNPAAGSGHPGRGSSSVPPDYVMMDFFNMPVTLPYAISEPFSTAGRIGLNSGLMPFHYIRRSTALHALFASLRISAIPASAAAQYKRFEEGGPVNNFDPRLNIDSGETVAGIEEVFAAGEIFRSAADICSRFLVPAGQTLVSTRDLAAGFWSDKGLTGDNTRERPYAVLYPLLTTKSNTFTTHFRVQPCREVNGRIVVAGDYRGSFLFERFIDPGDTRLQTAEFNPDTKSLEPLYQFRNLQIKQFMPW